MNNRLTSDSAKPVSLFPFLAVLLCTMGALLVLLVVLAQRAGERVLAEAVPPALPANQPTKIQQAPPEQAEQAEQLRLELNEVRTYQKQLDDLRQRAEGRLRDEQQRLSHFEQHTRELEHELARLSLASEQLKATTANQEVDQQQAEKELARLAQLIKDTQVQLEHLREEQTGKKSYAIVPYRGPNGTYRKPVYIECRKDGIVIHPEGIQLKASDFRVPKWAGNPLAAALRATREHVNAQAAKAGDPNPPDPYPVILVRPDGIPQYSVARAAITSWDSSFGYEFIDGDWELEFPEGPDPLLARQQEHAILLARERLARLIQSAPRRFQGTGYGGGSSSSGRSIAGGHGFGSGTAAGDSSSTPLSAQSSAANSGQGGGNLADAAATSTSVGNSGTNRPGEAQFGAMSGEGVVDTGSELSGNATEARSEAGGTPGEFGESSEQYAQGSSQSAAEGASSEASQNGGGQSKGRSVASGNSANTSGGSSSGSSMQMSSIAASQGRNWAVKSGGPGSVPIRRPIQVVVRANQIALLPSRHATNGEASTGKVVSLDQPMDQISTEFVTALRTRIEEWGLAGSGLYWRPVLNLQVGPGAENTVDEVMHLLKDSGVELSLPETADASQGGTDSATR